MLTRIVHSVCGVTDILAVQSIQSRNSCIITENGFSLLGIAMVIPVYLVTIAHDANTDQY